ncbi:hypothetical protein SEPCBS57363_003290 [Sporothrix epigloea]|uniref:Uncharacterized protein n=1 Tax=Sporothrix epigloea TaxID=1892477 RepID=A0ABP0DKM9_9PEZI
MDATESSLLPPEPLVLRSVVDIFLDPNALVMLLATIFGFVLPMLWIYPPVAPRPSDFLNETHSKLGSNTANLDRDKSASAQSTATEMPTTGTGDKPSGHIDSLRVYPIVSCPGIRVAHSRVLPTGLEFDHLFTFAQLQSPFPARAGTIVKSNGHQENDKEGDEASDDELKDWKAIDQRQFPRLASLQVELWRPDLTKIRRVRDNMRPDERTAREASMRELYVVVRYPWQEAGWLGRWEWVAAKLLHGWRAVPEVEMVLPVALPTTSGIKAHATVKFKRVQLPGRSACAVDLSAELPRSLQLYLGVSNCLGLLRLDAEHGLVNYSNKRRVPPAGQAGDKALEPDDQALQANVIGM